jgi:hypothetical protein
MNLKYYLGEVWLPIRGYEGLYEVSNFGRVRSLNYMNKGVVRILRTRARLGCYVKVALRKDEKVRYYRMHRLVATAFLPAPQQGETQVEHINGDKRDNRVENVRWCSPKGNMNNPQTRFHISQSLRNPKPEVRARMSAGQKRRFQRERETRTGRYAST